MESSYRSWFIDTPLFKGRDVPTFKAFTDHETTLYKQQQKRGQHMTVTAQQSTNTATTTATTTQRRRTDTHAMGTLLCTLYSWATNSRAPQHTHRRRRQDDDTDDGDMSASTRRTTGTPRRRRRNDEDDGDLRKQLYKQRATMTTTMQRR
jgi:hypothetical protein